MSKLEDDPAAKELRALLCSACYRSLIEWIGGAPGARPFAFCALCAPIGKRWLEQRQSTRRD